VEVQTDSRPWSVKKINGRNDPTANLIGARIRAQIPVEEAGRVRVDDKAEYRTRLREEKR
jgi:hypothetical protein